MAYAHTVLGPIPTTELGFTLPHEHVLVDFVGADQVSPDRYEVEDVLRVMEPLLAAAGDRGVRTFVDCSPDYLGRDPRLLAELSRRTGLHIITNTGYYKEPYLPPHAFTDSVEELAARWIDEAQNGLGNTGVYPGFIKIAVNPGPLIPVQQKIVRAAARTHLATSLPIASHTANGVAALETLDLLDEEGVSLDRFIVVHTDAEQDRDYHLKIADRGAWVEYDAVGWKPIAEHVELITWFLERRGPSRLLVSHDGGWYWVGKEHGGEQKPFTAIHDELLPALDRAGVSPETIERLFVSNPAAAFAVDAS